MLSAAPWGQSCCTCGWLAHCLSCHVHKHAMQMQCGLSCKCALALPFHWAFTKEEIAGHVTHSAARVQPSACSPCIASTLTTSSKKNTLIAALAANCHASSPCAYSPLPCCHKKDHRPGQSDMPISTALARCSPPTSREHSGQLMPEDREPLSERRMGLHSPKSSAQQPPSLCHPSPKVSGQPARTRRLALW